MEFLSVLHSDVGIRKKTNQDSVLIKEAMTDYGRIMLAVICDGMGGLAKGEIASASLIRAFLSWFEKDFPEILYNERNKEGIRRDVIEDSLNALVLDVNKKIVAYAQQHHITMGTTAAVLLAVEGKYYTMNIGDSRIYKITDSEIVQLTKDQTFVQKEMDLGRMTLEEAKVHPQRNVLLQCVGASEVILPEFTSNEYQSGDVYMLCSDGFRHLITTEEFRKVIVPTRFSNEDEMRDAAIYFTELNKSRQEKDNISVILLKVC